MVVIISISLISCGSSDDIGTDPISSEDQISPAQTADAFLEAFRDRDTEKLKEYYEGDVADLSMIEEEDDPALSGVINVLAEKIFDFDYAIGEEQIDGSSAKVAVTITTYDFAGIMQEIMSDLLSDAVVLGIAGLDQEEMEVEINELISGKFSDALASASKDCDISTTMNLVKKDGKWVVKSLSNENSFINALSGGLMDLADSLADAEN